MHSVLCGISRISSFLPVRVVWLCAFVCVCTPIFSQSDETSIISDDEEMVMTAAENEALDRLRLHQLDLRKATIEDLLFIPGITRRSAASIIAGVRSGRITSLDDIGTVFGVQPDAGDLLRPFVFLGPSSQVWKSTARTTATRTIRSDDKTPSARVRQRIHWLSSDSWTRERPSEADIGIDKDLNEHGRRPSMTGFVRTNIDEAWGISIGWFQYRAGLALSTSGTRSSIYDPGTWDRTFAAKSAVQRMSLTDEQSNMRGVVADIAWKGGRIFAGAGMTMDKGTATRFVSGEVHVSSIRSRLCIIDNGSMKGEKEIVGSIGHSSPTGSMFVEARLPYGQEASAALLATYDIEPSLEGSVLIRSLGRTGRVAVPSIYHGLRREEGGSLGVRFRVLKDWNGSLVFDRFRTQDPSDVAGRWQKGSGVRTSVSLAIIPRSTLKMELLNISRMTSTSASDRTPQHQEVRRRWNLQSTIEAGLGVRWITGIQIEKKIGNSDQKASNATVLWTDVGWKGNKFQARARWILFDVYKGMTAYTSFPANSGSFGGTPVSGEGAGLGILIVLDIVNGSSASFAWRSIGDWSKGEANVWREKQDASIQVDFRL